MSLVEKYFPKELYAVLKALDKQSEGTTTMEISELAEVSHSFLLGVLPSLKNGEFVSIERVIKDKRQKLVKLTERGRYLLQALECFRATLQGNYALIRALVKSYSKIDKET